MRCWWVSLSIAGALALVTPAALLGVGRQPQQPGTAVAARSPQRTMLDRYCVTCHNQQLKTADLYVHAGRGRRRNALRGADSLVAGAARLSAAAKRRGAATLADFVPRRPQRRGFEAGIEVALRHLLVEPAFLFRIERDPPDIAPNTTYRVTDLDLASRLSFFLWSSIPDEALLDVAERGRLSDPAMLQQQVRRMLADRRSEAFVTNFTGQWLYLRNLPEMTRDLLRFPDFDENLRRAFRRETELFFESILQENRSVLALLTADYTFVNERLARHYGIPAVKGSHFRRVTVTNASRRGLLGQGSILAATSYSHRTSPVVRGKWILENLLGAPPPPPPPTCRI